MGTAIGAYLCLAGAFAIFGVIVLLRDKPQRYRQMLTIFGGVLLVGGGLLILLS